MDYQTGQAIQFLPYSILISSVIISVAIVLAASILRQKS